MRDRYRTLLAMGTLIVAGACGAQEASSDDGLTQQLHQCAQIIDSLHSEKPGQLRVFASDGSEFTAGQVQWMKGQLRLITEASARGNVAEATLRLAEIQKLLATHRPET